MKFFCNGFKLWKMLIFKRRVCLRLTWNLSIIRTIYTYSLMLHIFHVFLLEEQQRKLFYYLMNAVASEEYGRLFATETKSLIFFEIMLFCWSKVIAGYDNQERLAYFGMSNNIDQENQPGNDDSTDRTKDIGENNYVRCTSCKVRSFFTYRGLNQHLRTCLRKTRDLIVTDSQPPSSSSANFFMTETVIIYKLVHWFATQINGLVAIW